MIDFKDVWKKKGEKCKNVFFIKTKCMYTAKGMDCYWVVLDEKETEGLKESKNEIMRGSELS